MIECFKIQILQYEDSSEIFDIKKGVPIYNVSCLSPYYVPNPTIIVADPFLFVKDNILYLFYEHKDWLSSGVIKMVCTKDLMHWSEPVIVLQEPFHLSFPWIFEENGHVYMIPETGEAKDIRLYKATDSTLQTFELEHTLLKEQADNNITMHYCDTCIFKKDSKYYLFTQVQYEDKINTLELYVSDSFIGDYKQHPCCPIQHNQKLGRNAGSLMEYKGKLLRFSQDCTCRYGDNVHISEIITLTPTEYKENVIKENIIPQESPFYKEGGHQYNAVQFRGNWIVATDAKEYHKLIGQRIINKIRKLLQ